MIKRSRDKIVEIRSKDMIKRSRDMIKRSRDKIAKIRSKDKIKRSRDLRIYKIRSSKVQMFKVKVKVKRVS